MNRTTGQDAASAEADPRRAALERTSTGSRRADVFLVEAGFFESRVRAAAAIAAGLVTADGISVVKPSSPIRPGAVLEARDPHPYVSRGGVKLAAGLDAFAIDPAGLTCLDVGSSTGGFTDALLQRGAAHVLAVDVGRDQLHPRLRADPRVESREGTDVRDLVAEVSASWASALLPSPMWRGTGGEGPGRAALGAAHPGGAGAVARMPCSFDLIVCDASFVPLRVVLPPALALAAPEARLIALIKPQYEAGRGAGKKGVVRDPAVHDAVCRAAEALVVSLGWQVIGIVPSPITGGDGNREFLLGARCGGGTRSDD